METYIGIFETGKDDDVFYDLKLGSDRRAINFMASHFGFFMINALNVSYLLFIEGYALRNIGRGAGKNFLHLLCLIGCFFQMCSCITSMTRYNMNDEFSSFWANGGTIFSNMGFAFCNIAVSVVWFANSDNRKRNWLITAIVFIVAHNVNSVLSYKSWDEKHFVTFRPAVIASAVYQTIVIGFTLYSINKGSISVKPSVASKDQFARLCQVLIAINILALACSGLLNMPMFIYPETGWIYATCVVFCKLLGQMDFAASIGGETSPLLG